LATSARAHDMLRGIREKRSHDPFQLAFQGFLQVQLESYDGVSKLRADDDLGMQFSEVTDRFFADEYLG